jgi:hypothetical protein
MLNGRGDDGAIGHSIALLKGDGSLDTTTIAVAPDLTGGVYLKGGLAYTGAVVAAVAPTTAASGTTALIGTGAASASGSGHVHTVSLAGGDPVKHLDALPYIRK